MNDLLIRNATVVNEGTVRQADVLVQDGDIARVAYEGIGEVRGASEIDATGLHLLPGLIDDQVHFREPGLTHKDDIASASAAAVAGGITSYMEMPNTEPQALTQELLAQKYDLAAASSLANYSFYMGVGRTNLDEVLRTDPRTVCGLKAFLGSSTGNMVIDDEDALEELFRRAHMLLAIHSESDAIIRRNLEQARARYGDNIPHEEHPLIRSAEACYACTEASIQRARRHGTRLHVLHISTARELDLFEPGPLEGKCITAEACVHHLWFTDADYATLGARIKWNPAVKTRADRDAVRRAVIEDRIDVLATDHAPHTWEEKQRPYERCPSGGPLVQHALVALLELVHQGVFTLERVVEKYCHAPARMFQVERRGYVREGYRADLVLVDLNAPWTVDPSNLLYKCGWSPFDGTTFRARVKHTFVNGRHVYADGRLDRSVRGERLRFDR